MKPRFSKQRNQALTRLEDLVIELLGDFIFVMLLPYYLS